MWLLKFHLAVSILCFLTLQGFATIFGARIKCFKFEEMLNVNKNKKSNNVLVKISKRIIGFVKTGFYCLVPVLNVLMCLTMIIVAFMSDSKYKIAIDTYKKEHPEQFVNEDVNTETT